MAGCASRRSATAGWSPGCSRWASTRRTRPSGICPPIGPRRAPTSTSCPRTSRRWDRRGAARRRGGLTIAIRACPACPALRGARLRPGAPRAGQPRDPPRAAGVRRPRGAADYADPKAARTFAREGLVDVVIDAFEHSAQYAPIRVGDAIWVRSHAGTERLGELRLWREEGMWQAVDRKVELDDGVPARDDEAALAGAARDAIQAVEQAAFGALEAVAPPTVEAVAAGRPHRRRRWLRRGSSPSPRSTARALRRSRAACSRCRSSSCSSGSCSARRPRPSRGCTPYRRRRRPRFHQW